MSGIVLRDELSEAVQKETFIKNGKEDCCKGIKYAFRIKGKYAMPGCYECKYNLENLNGKTLAIAPGEMTFIVTEETLELPENIFCHLNADTSSFEGILALDGLCIEPGYRGPLLFGLFNSSRKVCSFKAGQKLFSGIFYKLESEAVSMVNKNHDFMYDFVIRPKRNKGVALEGVEHQGKNKEKKLKIRFLREWLRKNKLLVMVSFCSSLLGGSFF